MHEIDILGVEYTIKGDNANNPKLIDSNAYCELYSKEIVYDENLKHNYYDCRSVENFEEFAKKVLRHEAMHAIFHESGCTEWETNEALVDFIAVQYPKIKKIFDKIESCFDGVKE